MIRIIVDTSVLRRLARGEARVSDLTSIPGSHRLKFSTHPYCLAELIVQFQRSEEDFDLWLKHRNEIAVFIDEAWPFVPDGQAFTYLVGVDKDLERVTLEAAQLVAIDQWNLLLEINTWEEMKKTKCLDLYIESLEPSKQEWVDELGNMKENMGDEIRKTADELRKLPPRTEKGPTENISRSVFYKTLEKVLGHHIIRNNDLKNPYNPEKNRNDGIDFKFCQFSPLPIIVLAKDKKLYSRLKAGDPEFVRQIVQLDEFVNETYDSLRRRVEAKAESFRIHCQRRSKWLGGLVQVT